MTENHDADATARAWIARLRSGAATPVDAEAFEAWRRQSDENERAVQKADRIWKLSGQAARASRHRRSVTRRLVIGGSVAASAAAAFQGAAFLGHVPGVQSLMADQFSDTASPAPLDLAGSGGWIDGASAVRITGSDQMRLLSGAVFVQPDPERDGPLTLAAGPLSAAISEGAAELRFGDRGAELACALGEVGLTAPEKIVLRPGDTVSVVGETRLVKSVQGVEEIASWRTGVLKFSRRRLGDAVADLNRHRRGRVIIDGAAASDREVSGVFHLDRPDEIVLSMVLSLGLNRRDLPGGIVILS